MKKIKIAISLNKPLLDIIDSKVDNELIRSRSQAIELFLRRGLKDEKINTAFLLVSKSDHKSLLKKNKGTSLIIKQLEFFKNNDINNVVMLTESGDILNEVKEVTKDININLQIVQANAKSNGEALQKVKEKLKDNNFIVMNGNIFLDFDLKKMIEKHLKSGFLATIGLMSRKETTRYGTAVMDGEMVIDFKEKVRDSESNVVNAGIYIFRNEATELFTNKQIELDFLPKIAKIRQLHGYFIKGDYEFVK